jgi:hypothetical protein
MELQHVNVKLLLQTRQGLDLEPLIPIFHGWIEKQNGDELLIDVADYRHVHEGPGIVLIGHEGNYSVDNTDNRLGLRYNCKAILNGSNQDRLKQATRAALRACERLESEPRLERKFLFNGRDVEIFINDRLVAPNDGKTREAFEPELRDFFQVLFGGRGYSISYGTDPRRLFAACVRVAQPFSVADLLATLN